jgi:hypothetical protein
MSLKTKIVTYAIALLIARQAAAAVSISGFQNGMPTPGLPDYTTYVLTATSDGGPVKGFNFVSAGGLEYGYFGELNQAKPFGAATVFNDLPDFFFAAAGMNRLADSQFLAPALGNLSGFHVEDATTLQGAWLTGSPAMATTSLPFAQIVLRNGALLAYSGEFIVGALGGEQVLRVDGQFKVPEPSAFAVAATGLFPLSLVRRRFIR